MAIDQVIRDNSVAVLKWHMRQFNGNLTFVFGVRKCGVGGATQVAMGARRRLVPLVADGLRPPCPALIPGRRTFFEIIKSAKDRRSKFHGSIPKDERSELEPGGSRGAMLRAPIAPLSGADGAARHTFLSATRLANLRKWLVFRLSPAVSGCFRLFLRGEGVLIGRGEGGRWIFAKGFYRKGVHLGVAAHASENPSNRG
jgi:hypothetical protein